MQPVLYLHISRYFVLDVPVSETNLICLNQQLKEVTEICSFEQEPKHKA